MFANLLVFKVPWFTTGFSYCRWWGVTCCLTATESVLPTCTRGFQSVGQIALASQSGSCLLLLPEHTTTLMHRLLLCISWTLLGPYRLYIHVAALLPDLLLYTYLTTMSQCNFCSFLLCAYTAAHFAYGLATIASRISTSLSSHKRTSSDVFSGLTHGGVCCQVPICQGCCPPSSFQTCQTSASCFLHKTPVRLHSTVGISCGATQSCRHLRNLLRAPIHRA